MDKPTPPNSQGDSAALQQALAEHLLASGAITSPSIEAAFRAVPRHLFLPGLPLEQVYTDDAIPTKHQGGIAISSSSQPAMMAVMLEQLALEPGHRVLEIGAGTGYNAALMAHIVGNEGHVVTIDIDQDIVDDARTHLDAAGFNGVQVLCADGGFGCAEAGPYDCIILTVGAEEITPAWREQLKPDGRLVLPLSLRGMQKSIAFVPESGHLTSRSIRDCGFIQLRGRFAEPDALTSLGPEPGLRLFMSGGTPTPPDTIYGWLTQPSRDLSTDLTVEPHEVWGGLFLWLALHAPGYCALGTQGEMTDRGIIPLLFGHSGQWNTSFTSGLLEERGLALFMRPPDATPPLEKLMEPVPFTLWVRGYGPDETIADRLLEQARAWDAAGRHATNGLRIRAYPADSGYSPGPTEAIIQKPFSHFVVDWP
jgi:protein-L-isoaspartate(D-aspartate) O-methyltransferase